MPRQRIGGNRDESTIRDLARHARLAWQLFMDRRVPSLTKAIPVAAILYLLSPVDLVPDVPVLGQLDDLVVLIIALRVFIGLAPPEIVSELLNPAARDTVNATYRVVDDDNESL